jgi:outer membrane protein OmpA-like peptidoglycan-associated protein
MFKPNPMKIKFTLVVLIILKGWIANSQNLIPNGSFEEFTTDTIPNIARQLENLKYWNYLATDSVLERPRERIGNRQISSKNVNPDGIVTLYFRNFQKTGKEELCKIVFMVQLKEKLKKDALYRLRYYLRMHPLGDHYYDSINSQLVRFFVRKGKLNSIYEIDSLEKEKPVGELPKKRTYRTYDRKSFVRDFFDFRVEGGEEYLVFGVTDTNATKIKSYFEFDHMQLVEIDEKLRDIRILEMGKSIAVENILFETNKTVLKPASYKVLDQLVDELRYRRKLKIEISGHTDNKGGRERNLELSEERAKVVVDYLLKQGISSERLSFKGYGSEKPITRNSTEKGRRLNRRVEITVLKR